ncbi:RING finger protein 224-like [Penaeus indicus]|uniref:RING finger protein 224-like n=1 Tax=Penaeus indicus TaxID=29960 RepID=UPI00300CB3C7
MEEESLCCTVCQERFSDTRTPRQLTCGHSICSPCVRGVIDNDRRCPECRRTFDATNPDDLAVNYQLLRLVRCLASGGPPQLLLDAGGVREPDAGRCEAHGSLRFFRCMSCGAWVLPRLPRVGARGGRRAARVGSCPRPRPSRR